MTVTSTTSRWEAVGNGSTTVFPYNNKIFANSDLKVYLGGVLQTITTHYTVSGAGATAGGNVTFLTAPASGVSVVIVRAVANTQEIDYPPGGAFPAVATEDGLDRRTIISQQNASEVSRALRFLESDANAPSGVLPSLDLLKGGWLRFNAVTGAPEAGAITSDVAYHGDVANILDWNGADNTGSNDNSSYLAQALAQSSNVFFPAGSWALDNSTSFELESSHRIFGEGYRSSRLVMTGDAASCFVNADPLTILQSCAFTDLHFDVTGTYDYLFDFNGLVGSDFVNLLVSSTSTVTTLFRTVKVSGQPSWVNPFVNTRWRVPDAAAVYIMDADFGDASISESAFTGGQGVILKGAGGLKIVGNRFDRALATGASGLTISLESSSGGQHIISNNQIEVNATYDILIDGDQGVSPNVSGMNITGNNFRSAAATASIYFKRTSGTKLNAVANVDDNNFTVANTVPSIVYDLTYWENIKVGRNNNFFQKDYGFVQVGRENSFSERTIASGAISVISSRHLVDTEGNAATDVLDTVNGLQDGEVTILSPANAAREVLVREGGNLTLTGGAEFRMNGTDAMIALVGTASGARELFRSGQVSLAWQPTPAFAVAGDSSFTYGQRSGLYSIVGNVLHWSLNLEFTTNAYTTASGALTIGTLPFNPASHSSPAAIGRLNNVTYQAGDEQISAYITTAGVIRFYRSVSGSASLVANEGNFPASTTFTLWLSGSYFLA